MEDNNLLEVEGLKTYFFTYRGLVKAVDGISFKVKKAEILGLVGESGCGKSVTTLSILRLVSPPGKIVEGRILYKGQDLLEKNEKEMMKIRGKDIAMIFQEPVISLNPVFTIGDQTSELVRFHERVSKPLAVERVVEMFRLVGLPNPEGILNQYPHQLSGGMCQRVMIAMMLACKPDLLIADEPTTALDVTIQAQILDLIKQIREKLQTSIIFISHDIGVVSEICDHVGIMYAGKIVEMGPVESLLSHPNHPYTQGLLRTIPKMGEKQEKLPTISGVVPDLINLPHGCRFHPRCMVIEERCRRSEPELKDVGGNHSVACFRME
jgi:oligopeptide/dipeptide ABC transporter ATP-binding protein